MESAKEISDFKDDDSLTHLRSNFFLPEKRFETLPRGLNNGEHFSIAQSRTFSLIHLDRLLASLSTLQRQTLSSQMFDQKHLFF